MTEKNSTFPAENTEENSKKESKTTRILFTVAIILVILALLSLSGYFLARRERQTIRIDIAPNQTESVSFEHLALVPGEECKYSIILSTKNARDCALSLSFVEGEPLTLKNYAYARIEAGGEILCDVLLADLFEDGVFTLPAESTRKRKTVTVTYYLPKEVGNEAQNAEAVFELFITASNQ